MEQIKTRFIQQENTRGRKEVYMQELHISVRNLVEFIFRAGDIDNRAGKLASAEAMMEGSRIHRKIQKSMDTSYQAEVPLKIEWKVSAGSAGCDGVCAATGDGVCGGNPSGRRNQLHR